MKKKPGFTPSSIDFRPYNRKLRIENDGDPLDQPFERSPETLSYDLKKNKREEEIAIRTSLNEKMVAEQRSIVDSSRETRIEELKKEDIKKCIKKIFENKEWYKNFLAEKEGYEKIIFKYDLVHILIEEITKLIYEDYGVNQENPGVKNIETKLSNEFNKESILEQIKSSLSLSPQSNNEDIEKEIEKRITKIIENQNKTLTGKIKKILKNI